MHKNKSCAHTQKYFYEDAYLMMPVQSWIRIFVSDFLPRIILHNNYATVFILCLKVLPPFASLGVSIVPPHYAMVYMLWIAITHSWMNSFLWKASLYNIHFILTHHKWQQICKSSTPVIPGETVWSHFSIVWTIWWVSETISKQIKISKKVKDIV